MLKPYSNNVDDYKDLLDKIKHIPKNNQNKFFTDLLILIDYAYEDDYENFDL